MIVFRLIFNTKLKSQEPVPQNYLDLTFEKLEIEKHYTIKIKDIEEN